MRIFQLVERINLIKLWATQPDEKMLYFIVEYYHFDKFSGLLCDKYREKFDHT